MSLGIKVQETIKISGITASLVLLDNGRWMGRVVSKDIFESLPKSPPELEKKRRRSLIERLRRKLKKPKNDN